MITSLHEVVGVAWQLLGSTSTSAVLWCVCVCVLVHGSVCVKCHCFRDTHSHGLLVVVKLCCCLSGCELQPVVVGTSCEEVTGIPPRFISASINRAFAVYLSSMHVGFCN